MLCSRPDARLLGWVCTRKDSYAIQYASAQALADPKKAAAIQDFLQRLARSTVWVGAHPNEWATLSAKLVRVDTGVMEDIARRAKLRYGLDPQQPGDLEASFGREADYWVKQGTIQRRPDMSALFDTRFNAAMQAASHQAIEQQAQGNRQTAN